MVNDKKEDDEWSRMTVGEKVRNVFQNITVEPMMFFHVVPSVFAGLATQNLNLEKACRVNLQYSDVVCSALRARKTEGFKAEEMKVQQLVASMSIWTTPLKSSIPALLIMFLGSWSDRKKRRKPFMMIPIVGEFLTCMGLLVCVYYFYELPMEVAGFVESFFPAITGGWITLFMAVFSYMGDITTVEMRTVRIGVLNLCGSVGFPLGTALSGIALKVIGFYGVFSLSAIMYVFSITYGYFRIKEAPKFDPGVEDFADKGSTRVGAVGSNTKRLSMFQFLKDFFDLKHIKETFSVVFRKTANNRRLRIILLITAQTFIIIAGHGEGSLIYLFLRYRFNWDEVKFSMFATYSVIVHIFGTSLSVGVFSHLLKCEDALIGILACVSKIMAGLVFAFAQNDWQVYLVPLVDILSGTSSIAMRSIGSKLVPPDELGKLNAVYGAFEAISPLLQGPVFAILYAHTMDTMPGAFFILGGSLIMPALLIFCWMYKHDKRLRVESDSSSQKTSTAEETTKAPKSDVSTPNTFTSISLNETLHGHDGIKGGHVNLGLDEKDL